MVDYTMEYESKRYLMKLISDKYKILRGQLFKAFGQNGYAVAYNDIANRFMGGNYTNERRMISEHKERFSKKGYSDYNYFALESLYSYLTFLTMLVDNIDDYTYHNGKRELTAKIYNTALDDTILYFNRNKEKEETGYYTGGVVLSSKEGNHAELNPLKTNNDKVDLSKSKDYQKYIREYVYTKHRKRTNQQFFVPQTESRLSDSNTSYSSEEDSLGTIAYKYHGKKLTLNIIKEERFYSDNGYPVTRIWAVSADGRLFKTVDYDGNVYNGALYNEEYEEVADAEESGEIFYPSAALKNSISERSTENNEQSREEYKTKTLKNGLENYTLFDDIKSRED